MEPQKLKRVVIKEELVALTSNYVDAILLSQLLYWSERVKDFDEFIKQEAEANNKDPENQLHGWIYKSLVELSEETMLGLTPNGIKNHLKKLCDSGFISIRQNKNKWDRRKEYKVNLSCIQKKLYDSGYSLDGYSLILPFAENANGSANIANGSANIANGSANIANRTVKNCKTVTEITTETTTEKKESKKSARGSYDDILAEIENPKLKTAYQEFLKMRKLIKSPMTDGALRMLIRKVEKLGKNTDEQIALLNNAVVHGWKSVYPLKECDVPTVAANEADETAEMLRRRREERMAGNG